MSFRILILGPELDITTTPLSKFDAPSVDRIERQEGTIKRCLVKIAKANLVVTLKEWETNPDAVTLVEIARLTNTPVVHEINFNSYVQPKND